MSHIWTLGIHCDKCEQTFGVRAVDTHVGYGQVLQAIRAEAARQGWAHFYGPMRRSRDICPAHRGSGA